jgi:glycosyltransferase involved in cell wall biosynthesis
MPSRQDMFKALLTELQQQIFTSKYKGQVEIWHDDSIDITTGKKRNILLQKSEGKYVVFIDDDDLVSDRYVELIMDCLNTNKEVDCVGINGVISFDGKDEKKWFISKDYGKWFENQQGYYRTPNHITPIKRNIAINVMFPEVTHGEDYVYSMGVLPHLKTEAIIDCPLYHYRFIKPYSPPSSNESNHPYRPAFR